MNLLLLLSALLSALTGMTGGRVAEVPQAVRLATISVSPAAAAAVQATTRPSQSHATLRAAAIAPITATASRDDAPARLTDRRRE